MPNKNLFLWELQKIIIKPTKIKDEYILNFRMKRPTERFHSNDPMLIEVRFNYIICL